jgi:hypothetical protein
MTKIEKSHCSQMKITNLKKTISINGIYSWAYVMLTSSRQRFKMLNFLHFFFFRGSFLPSWISIRNPKTQKKPENEENLERSLGEISAATEVQVDKLTISLENWFQNFI